MSGIDRTHPPEWYSPVMRSLGTVGAAHSLTTRFWRIKPSHAMNVHPVDPRVGNVRNNDPSLYEVYELPPACPKFAWIQEDLDFDSGLLHVRRSLGEQKEGDPKTRASKKPVPIKDRACILPQTLA
jgi:hypothetical protein